MSRNIAMMMIILWATITSLVASVTFGSQYSSIELLNGAQLNVLSATMSLTEGRIRRSAGSRLTSTNPVNMTNCIYVDGDEDIVITGNVGQTTGATPIIINGAGQALRLEPEILLLDVLFRGSGARITGQPMFAGNNQLNCEDSATYVNVGLQSSVNKNINLNGGTISLTNDLKLSDKIVLNGGGTVQGNNNKVSIGGKSTALRWPHPTYTWKNNVLLELNGDISLTGTWVFADGTNLIGNGNMLDLNAGMIVIPAGATVSMSEVLLENFATTTTKIIWGDAARLRISGVDIGLQAGVSPLTIPLNNGGIYVDGESTVLGRGRRISFGLKASLSVDGVALNGDPLAAVNPFPIIPSEGDPAANPGPQGQRNYVNTFNSGMIRRPSSGSSGTTIIDNSVTNIGSVEISVSNLLTFTSSTVYNGDFTTLSFATASVPLVIVAPNVNATLTNVTLRNFEFNYVQLGAGGQFTFGNNTYITLAQSSVAGFPCESLTRTYTFKGSVVIDGNNHCIDLGDDFLPGQKGNFFIKPSSQLSIQNLTIKNLSGNKIRCAADTSVLALRNVTLIMDSDFSFTRGALWFQDGLTDIQGSYTFKYQSGVPSFIFNNTTLRFSEGSTFLYNPPNNNRDLVVFEGSTAHLSLMNGTLASTRTGIRLTIGSLDVAGASFLTQNTGAPLALSEGIAFGDGNPGNEITVTIGSGAILELLSGKLVYDHMS